MPITVPQGLPAARELEKEKIFAMDRSRAFHQDIRPLNILILNLMPTKAATETQLLRLLSNTPLQLNVEFLRMESHAEKHTPLSYLLKFYRSFSEVEEKRYDGMIITGAPVERMNFRAVDYWPELCRVMDWSKENVFFTFLKSGDHVVTSRVTYIAVYRLLTEHLKNKYGIEATLVDTSDPEAVRAAIRPNTRLIHLETPGNPTIGSTCIRKNSTADFSGSASVWRIRPISSEISGRLWRKQDCKDFFPFCHSNTP